MSSEKGDSGVDIKRQVFQGTKIDKINFLQVSVMFSQQKNIKTVETL